MKGTGQIAAYFGSAGSVVDVAGQGKEFALRNVTAGSTYQSGAAYNLTLYHRSADRASHAGTCCVRAFSDCHSADLYVSTWWIAFGGLVLGTHKTSDAVM